MATERSAPTSLESVPYLTRTHGVMLVLFASRCGARQRGS